MAKLALRTDRSAEAWMEQGIQASRQVQSKFQEMKVSALGAGMFFRMAKEAVKDGHFEELLKCYEGKIQRRTVYHYMQFLNEALEWAAAARPELNGDTTALFNEAKNMVIQSPKPLVALMRQLGEMRKFGEYDAVKYARRKLLGNGGGQLELDFGQVMGSLEALQNLENTIWQLPDGKQEHEALEELEQKLEQALGKVREQKQKLGTIPI